MKKFALLGAVAALATAGGVFAAWQFTNGGVYEDQNNSLNVTVVGEVTNNGYGTVSVTGALALSLDGNGVSNNNTIVGTFDQTKSIVFQYTPATNDLGVTVDISFDYTENDWFTLSFTNVDDFVPSEENSYKYTITHSLVTFTAKKQVKTTTDKAALEAAVSNLNAKFTFKTTANPTTPIV